MSLEGIDVSVYQGQVDWGRVRQSGRVFAAVKATEGVAYADPTFPANWAGLASAQIARIAYCFFHPSQNAVDQCDQLHAYVRDHGRFVRQDGVMLDLEETDGLSPNAVLNAASSFVQRAWRQINRPVFLYTYADFWVRQLGNPTDSVLAQCPLWMASYGSEPPATHNWPNGASFHQYSSGGRVPGVNGAVDLDRFFGDETALSTILAAPPAGA